MAVDRLNTLQLDEASGATSASGPTSSADSPVSAKASPGRARRGRRSTVHALPRKLVEIDGDEPKVAADEGGASSVAW